MNSFTTQTNRLNVQFLTTSLGTNFNGNVNVNANLNLLTGTRNTTKATKPVVLNAVDAMTTRPYLEQDLTEIRETFSLSSANWDIIPAHVPVDPVIDSIGFLLNPPATANTQGKIQSDYLWRVRANTTNDLYQLNFDPDSPPINGCDRGIVLYTPANVPMRHFAISRPLRAIRSTNNGMSYELRFMLTNALGNEQRFSFGFVQTSFVASFNGINLQSANNSWGFVLDHGQFGSYQCRPYARVNGTTYYANSAPVVNQGKLITLRLNWDHENPNPAFFINNGDGASQNYIAGVDLAVGFPISTSISWDPFCNCLNSDNKSFGIILNQWNLSYYKYTA